MHPLSLGHSLPRPRERTGEPGVWEGAAVLPSARVVGMGSSVSCGGCRRIQCADRRWEGAGVGSARERLNVPRARVWGAAVEAGAHSCLWWVRATAILLEPHLAGQGYLSTCGGTAISHLRPRYSGSPRSATAFLSPIPLHTRALGVQLPWGAEPCCLGPSAWHSA